MARCFWLICSGLFLFYAAVASESLTNGTLTTTTGNVTEREGREYNVHPPTQKVEEAQSLSPSPRPKSLGTGTWKAIKIWNEPIGVSSSSTAKQASSPQRVVASSAPRVNFHVIIMFICPLFMTTHL